MHIFNVKFDIKSLVPEVAIASDFKSFHQLGKNNMKRRDLTF